MKYELTDEEILDLTGEINPETGEVIKDYLKAAKEVADKAQAKLQAYYRDMTGEELGGKVFEIVDSANFKQGKTSIEATDQILSLVMGYFVEKLKRNSKTVDIPDYELVGDDEHE